MTANLYYYLKAVLAGISSGIVYLSAFLGTDFGWDALAHVSVGHWVGTVVAIFGVGGLTAVVSNGPPPVKPSAPAVIEPPIVPPVG